jgi:hypothetical protein
MLLLHHNHHRVDRSCLEFERALRTLLRLQVGRARPPDGLRAGSRAEGCTAYRCVPPTVIGEQTRRRQEAIFKVTYIDAERGFGSIWV